MHETICLFSRSLVMTSLVSLKSITFHSQSLTLGLCLGTQSAPRSTLPLEGTAREDPRETTSLDARCRKVSEISQPYKGKFLNDNIVFPLKCVGPFSVGRKKRSPLFLNSNQVMNMKERSGIIGVEIY